VIYQEAMGISGVTMPPDPVQEQPTYAGALQMFEGFKQIRVLFDNGAGGSQPGQPKPAFEHSYSQFPIPGTQARSWYLSNNGVLAAQPPARAGTNSFVWDAHSTPLTDFTGDTAAGSGGLWTATPPYQWVPHPQGRALSYLTKPLKSNTTVIGGGALRLWVRSSTPNVDLQATVSEVRPDGQEVFVQNGWVRGNERKLDANKSTPLEPVLSLRKSDVAAMPKGQYVPVTVPLYYEGHTYRAGSRIRVVISAPNGDQPIWSFSQTQPQGRANVSIAYSSQRPSKLLLPTIPHTGVPTGLPPCPGLRGEPCRQYQPLTNNP
jgi:putative CocE/NonD family hydrolase